MKVRESRSLKVRIVVVSIVFMGLFGILALRGYQLQIYKAGELGGRVER